jgi:hypothetical protein
MVNHHVTEVHDPSWKAVPGHSHVIVYVHETRCQGLHCEGDGCGWCGGSFRPGRWTQQQMDRAWARHLQFVEAGGVIVHGRAGNVLESVCKCVSCLRAGRWGVAR